MAKAKKRAAAPRGGSAPTPQERLIGLINDAVSVAKTARRHRKLLGGVNYYANKMAELRADATNAYGRLPGRSVGDASALAELMETVFSVDADPRQRAQAGRDLQFALRTTWVSAPADQSPLEEGGLFPLVTLNLTKRGYLIRVGRQMNGCYASAWFDACAVMMRRLLESSILEAFEAKKIDSKIKNANGDFFQLTALIDAALGEKSWNLPRNVRKELRDLRDLGHRSAHNRYYLATKSDIDKHAGVYREAVEAFLSLAGLL